MRINENKKTVPKTPTKSKKKYVFEIGKKNKINKHEYISSH